MSDSDIYTWKILPGTYPRLRDLALWKGVLEDTYLTYPNPELHKYRVLVSWWAAQAESQQTHMISVVHRFHMFPRGAI
jgi:hypothetical protein